MIRYLTLKEVLYLHRRLIETSGGVGGIRDKNALESALAQPKMTFGGVDLYPTVFDKASALGFSLIMNHPFLDGNKRVSHAVMETFLILNGWEINANVDEQEKIILDLAKGEIKRDDFTLWLKNNVIQKKYLF